ncbi:two-component regulator propeller domain-containing protein [Calditrichota bacterium GD2]
MMRFFILIILNIFFYGLSLQANSTYFFKHLTTRDGLSQSSIISIVQDKHGFIWLGTMDGLNRFDGYSVKVFKKHVDDSTGLQNNRINDLKVDAAGHIWIANDLGINILNPKTEEFTILKLPLENESIVLQLEIIDRDKILVRTLENVYAVHLPEKRVEPIKGLDGSPVKIKKLNRQTCIFTNNKIYVLDGSQARLWIDIPQIQSQIVDVSAVDRDALYILTLHGFFEYQISNQKLTDFSERLRSTLNLPAVRFTSLIKLNQNTLWLGSTQGILSVNLQHLTFEQISDNLPNNLSSRNITVLYKDKTDIIWVGTFDSGVNYIDLNHGSFYNILPRIGGKKILSSPLVYAFWQDDSDTILWVGTDNGLDQFKIKNGTISKVSGKSILLNKRIRALHQDEYGSLWVGTYEGLYKVDPALQQIKLYKPYEDKNKNIVIKIFPLDKDRLLVGLKKHGLFQLDVQKGIFKAVQIQGDTTEAYQKLFITDIKRNSTGNIYVATYGSGLFEYDPQKNNLIPLTEDSELKTRCSFIYCIYPEGANTIWIGTYGEGLFIWNLQSKHFEHLSTQDGLPNDVIYGILRDDSHNYWVSTIKGLCKIIYFPAQKPSFVVNRVWDYSDGLPDNEFNFGAYFKSNRWLYFGTVNGFTCFDPISFKINQTPPQIFITDIKINQQPLKQLFTVDKRKKIWQSQSLQLNYDQNTVEFEFTALHFSNPLKNTFAYRLKGFEENWTYVPATQRKVVYRKLPGGHYVFQIKAANADGVWSPQVASISLFIKKPFWQMWWFRLIMLMAILGLAYAIHILKTVKIKSRNRLLKELNQKLKKENKEKLNIMSTLRETLEKFQTIFNNAPLGIFYIDQSGRLTECNEYFVKIIGSSYERIIGINMIHDIKDKQLIQAIKDGLSGKTGYYEGRYSAITSPKTIPARAIIRGIHSIDGQVIGAVGIVEDLSEIEKEKLRETVIRNISQAVLTTEDLESFYEVFDRELSKTIDTKNLFVALYDDQNKIFTVPLMKDEKDAFKAVPAEGTLSYYVIQKGKPCLFKEKEMLELEEKGLIKRVGAPSKCWLGVPLKIENQTIGILVVQDYEDEEAFNHETLELLEVLSSSLASSIRQKQNREFISLLTKGIAQSSFKLIIANRNGDILYSNLQVAKAMETGKKPRLADLLKTHIASESDVLERCLKNGEKWSGEISRIINEKQTAWEFLSINPVTNEAGQVTHFVVVIEDITEAKRLQNQLQQAQKIESIGTLAGGIAHDFNNLLTVINGHAEIALLKLNQDKKIHSDIVSILHAGKRAANLTRQLLAFSRKQIFKAELLDINEVIQSMEKMARRLIGEDIEIKIELTPHLPYIKADPSQLEQVLMNLIVNARDAIHEWSKTSAKIRKLITIKTEKIFVDRERVSFEEIKKGTYIRLSVADTGVGMDEKTREKVFEPFFTTKEVGKGTGLGLSTVYGIVKQNQGFVELESEKGKGATFKVYWPVAEEHLKNKLQSKDAKDEIISGHGNVLVVEDDESVREFIKDILLHSGYNVFTANNGREGADLIKKINFKLDLVITDMIMPEMNGNELADLVRQKFPDTKILYTSGYTETRIIHEELMLEGTQFLHKPFTIVEFTNVINKLLQSD